MFSIFNGRFGVTSAKHLPSPAVCPVDGFGRQKRLVVYIAGFRGLERLKPC